MSIWNKFFGKNSGIQFTDKLAWLGCDMHNHVLPGIDDGAKTVEDSLQLVQGLKELGIHRCIATPHIISGVYDNSEATIKAATDELKQRLLLEKVVFDLEYSAEYMIDDGFLNKLNTGKLCVLPNKHVLIEMSYLAESQMFMEVVFRLQTLGYKPILAHPERYNYFHNDFGNYKSIKEAGCLLQLNILAISGYYGTHVKAAAAKMIKEGMYDFVGTDMHHERHLNAIKKLVLKYDVKGLLKHNPIKNAIAF